MLLHWLDTRDHSQGYLAKKVGISRTRLNHYLMGTRKIPADVAIKLNRVTRIRMDDIVTGGAHKKNRQ